MKPQHICIGVLLILNSCTNFVLPDRPRLLLFVDMTLSLNSDQSKRTVELAKQLLHGKRNYSSIAVYPIGAADQAPEPILSEIVKEHVSEHNRQLQKWDKRLDESVQEYKSNAHTCIMDSIEFASKQMASDQPKDSSTDLVFITDMIEDCPSTPLGVPTRLDKPTIKREIELASRFPTGRIKVTKAHVFILYPGDVEDRGPRKPRIDDLEQFWRTFVSRCDNPNVMISLSGLPPALMN